jgi:ribosomal protein L4
MKRYGRRRRRLAARKRCRKCSAWLPNRHLPYEAGSTTAPALHRGTHATKNRALVSGGGKALALKGTGRARGLSRNPL